MTTVPSQHHRSFWALPKKRMIVFILFSVLIASLGFAYLQLKYSVNHGPTSLLLQAQAKQAKQAKQEAALKESQKARHAALIQEIRDKRKVVQEKREALHEAIKDYVKYTPLECAKDESAELAPLEQIHTPYNPQISVYSAKILQEEAEDEARRYPGIPSSLGLALKERNPNTKRLAAEEEADLEVGAINPFLECGIIGHPSQITTYIAVRVNTPQRWLRLIVTRYDDESLEDTVLNYLKTIGTALFDGKTPFFV